MTSHGQRHQGIRSNASNIDYGVKVKMHNGVPRAIDKGYSKDIGQWFPVKKHFFRKQKNMKRS
jgi:hypothetical protein